MDSPQVYKVSEGEALRQGEVLSNVYQLITVATAVDDIRKAAIQPLRHPFAIILSQDCDLEWDYRSRGEGEEETSQKVIPNILLCEAVPAESLKSEREMSSKLWAKIFNNTDPRYQYLEECPTSSDAQAHGFPALGIDFKRFFTVSTASLYADLSARTQRRARLDGPYLSQLSTRFYHFQLRVALPREHGQVFPSYLDLAKDLHYRL